MLRQGTELVVRNLSDSKERTFADVTEYMLAKDGKWLVYAVAGKEQTGGVFAVRLSSPDLQQTPGYAAPYRPARPGGALL